MLAGDANHAPGNGQGVPLGYAWLGGPIACGGRLNSRQAVCALSRQGLDGQGKSGQGYPDHNVQDRCRGYCLEDACLQYWPGRRIVLPRQWPY